MYETVKELIGFGIHCPGKMAAGGVLTMLISSGFQELNIPDKESVAQSNGPESSGKFTERKFTVLVFGSK